MSNPTTSNRPPPPSEDDLYKLYDEVRRGFLEESPTTTTLNNVHIPRMDGDDFSSLIDDYQDRGGGASQDPPEYERGDSRPLPAEKGEWSYSYFRYLFTSSWTLSCSYYSRRKALLTPNITARKSSKAST